MRVLQQAICRDQETPFGTATKGHRDGPPTSDEGPSPLPFRQVIAASRPNDPGARIPDTGAGYSACTDAHHDGCTLTTLPTSRKRSVDFAKSITTERLLDSSRSAHHALNHTRYDEVCG